MLLSEILREAPSAKLISCDTYEYANFALRSTGKLDYEAIVKGLKEAVKKEGFKGPPPNAFLTSFSRGYNSEMRRVGLKTGAQRAVLFVVGSAVGSGGLYFSYVTGRTVTQQASDRPKKEGSEGKEGDK